jgi:hypothetical protein
MYRNRSVEEFLTLAAVHHRAERACATFRRPRADARLLGNY